MGGGGGCGWFPASLCPNPSIVLVVLLLGLWLLFGCDNNVIFNTIVQRTVMYISVHICFNITLLQPTREYHSCSLITSSESSETCSAPTVLN